MIFRPVEHFRLCSAEFLNFWGISAKLILLNSGAKPPNKQRTHVPPIVRKHRAFVPGLPYLHFCFTAKNHQRVSKLQIGVNSRIAVFPPPVLPLSRALLLFVSGNAVNQAIMERGFRNRMFKRPMISV
jgi:hypothetical protein